MAYWLDEGWHGWPEVVQAGTAAAGLYARCGSYIADQTTDGFVPSGVARMYGTAEWVQRLVDVGLWRTEGDGYRDTRYFPLNPTAEAVAERKRKAAERQKRHRAKQGVTRDTTGDKRVSHNVSHKTPTLPPLKGVGGGAGDSPKPHAFADDGSGQSCSRCGFLRINKIHMKGRAA